MATPDWLRLRIVEERERRDRESMILDRLPRATDELRSSLCACIEGYNEAFGADLVEIETEETCTRILVRDFEAGQWLQRAQIEILIVPELPGFQIDRAGSPLIIEVGLLPGEKIFYRDREKDQYLTMEELTRRVLDRSLFPKLGE